MNRNIVYVYKRLQSISLLQYVNGYEHLHKGLKC